MLYVLVVVLAVWGILFAVAMMALRHCTALQVLTYIVVSELVYFVPCLTAIYLSDNSATALCGAAASLGMLACFHCVSASAGRWQKSLSVVIVCVAFASITFLV